MSEKSRYAQYTRNLQTKKSGIYNVFVCVLLVSCFLQMWAHGLYGTIELEYSQLYETSVPHLRFIYCEYIFHIYIYI